MTELITDPYEALATDIDAIITEAVFNSREALYVGYWEVGQRIREYEKGEVTKLVQDLAVSLQKSERTLWYAVQFYDKFPVLNTLPEGKNLSWNKIITKYLPDGQKEKNEHEWQCPNCRFKGKSHEFRL